MLRVAVDLVPHGDEDGRRTVGRAVVGQLGRTSSGRHRYAAAVWDDWKHTTAAVVTVDHARDDGLWTLVQVVLQAVAGGAPPNELPEATLARLEQALVGEQRRGC